jgi:DNA polymerase V
MAKRYKSNDSNNRQHGGSRPGAGRPLGSGPYGEPTRPVRIPESMIVPIRELLDRHLEAARAESTPQGDNVFVFDPESSTSQPLPFFSHRVAAGFPSPADDHLDNRLDLNEHLVKHPAATFFVRVEGLSMIGAGIHPDDILVVDRSEDAGDGRIVVAAVDGELTVKRLRKQRARVYLEPENPDFQPLEITREMNFVIWGVVTNVIHKV